MVGDLFDFRKRLRKDYVSSLVKVLDFRKPCKKVHSLRNYVLGIGYCVLYAYALTILHDHIKENLRFLEIHKEVYLLYVHFNSHRPTHHS